MRCPKCSTENPEQNRYCGACGLQLATLCPRCDHRNPIEEQSCIACGSSLRAEGERKFATVMFADIVGSTQLIAGLDAEQAMERLQPTVGEMCVAVQRFEGTVVRTLGDGL